MAYRRTKRAFFAFLLLAASCPLLYSAEQADTARLLTRMAPPRAEVPETAKGKGSWFTDLFYEASDIIQNASTGHWSELTYRIGYAYDRIQGYVGISQFNRFDTQNNIVNLGYDLRFEDSYAHWETGIGWDVDYIQKFQNTVEYAHRLHENLYWQIGYSYRNYDVGDTHLVYPGLIYYFGSSYIGADYGVSFVEGRDTGHVGTVKGDFAITNFLHWYSGIAFGERLYDIDGGLDARYEFGYILFTGLTFDIYKDIKLRTGYSYGTEKPKFIKKSLDFTLSARF